MRIKHALLATAICLTAVYGADSAAMGTETHVARWGAHQPCLTRHPGLEHALTHAAKKQSLSATPSRELSGALFDSELA